MGEKIDQIYMELQGLMIQPTEGNIAILTDVFVKLKELYAEIGGEKECPSKLTEQPLA